MEYKEDFWDMKGLIRYITICGLIICLLTLFASFSHAATIYENEAHNVTFLNQQSNTAGAGYIMKFDKDVTTINFTTDSLDTSTRCILYNADSNPMSIITTASISNHNCNLVYSLNTTSFFGLGADANGGTFNQRYTNTVSFPINLGSGNITDGFLITSGTSYASQTLLFSLTGIWITYNVSVPISITSFTSPTITNESVNLQYTFTGDFQNLTIFRNGSLIHSVLVADSSFLDTGLTSNTKYGYDLIVCSSSNCDSRNLNVTTLQNTPQVTVSLSSSIIFLSSMLFCITLLAISLILIGFGSPLIKMLGTAFLIMFFILFPSIIDETNFISDITMIFAIKITCWSMAILSAIVAMVYLAYTYIFAPKEKGKYDYIYHR